MRGLLMTCLLLAVAPGAMGEEAAVLRVVSYNIHHAEGKDGKLDLERIAAVVKETHPDIVCLQEVDRGLPRTGSIDMPARFADVLGMTAVFEANYRFDGGEYGNCTLTALPIVAHENFALPGTAGNEPRGVLRVTIALDETSIDVFNTHWALTREERALQGEALLTHVRDGVPALLAGDFNERAQGAGVRTVQTHFENTLGDGDDASSALASEMGIDHIFVSPGIAAVASGAHHSDTSAVASDHVPYVAVLRVTDTPAP